MPAPLLLHSLEEFEELIGQCLEAAGARSLVEIGSETGAFTRRLLGFVRDRGGRLTTVEPLPTAELVELARSDDAFELIEGRSPAALADVGAPDAWILDGDHNYWTVSRELDAALDFADAARGAPLIFLHDVTWPCARRDFYYDPASIEADGLHAHSWTRGVEPGTRTTVDSGLRGDGAFAVACEEGGPRNGILTAIEDVMQRRGGLRLHVVPAVYGLGVLLRDDAPYADAIEALMTPFTELPLLARLEENRVALYLRVLKLQDELNRATGARRRVFGAYDQRIADLGTENAELRMALATARATA